MELDNKWIEEYEQDEEPYNDFYREKTKTIEIYYFYINKSSELEKIKQHHCVLDEYNKLSREKLVTELKSNIVDNKIKYSLLSILKHNITIDPNDLKNYLESDLLSEDNKYVATIPDISDIYFDDTISFLKQLNSLFIIFYESSEKRRKNMTKKIVLSSKQHRKTKRKALKGSMIKLSTHT